MSEKTYCPQCGKAMRYVYGGSKEKGTRWRELACKCGFHYRGERLMRVAGVEMWMGIAR